MPQGLQRKCVVINRGSPELNYLAAALAREGMLEKYLRPYANQGRLWENAFSKVPGVGPFFNRTFGRRTLPLGIDSSLIQEVGVIEDISSSFLRLISRTTGKKSTMLVEEALKNEIRKKAQNFSSTSNVIIGPFYYSVGAFTNNYGTKILNYPTAHHNYAIKLLTEEKEIEPSFASMFSINDIPPIDYIDILNSEITSADHIFLGSTFAKNSFLSENICETKLHVIPYGVDAMFFTKDDNNKKKSTDDFNVLFVGQIGQRKGISYLLKAYDKFKGCGTQLTLVGKIIKNDRPLIPYRDIFTYIPDLPRSQLPGIYEKADVFVFPTLLEGMGLVVLEAMAAGLPIITTSHGPCDLIRDGIDGFIIPIRDTDTIVEKLEFLRKNEAERKRMGENAKAQAKRFKWEIYQEKVVRIISPFLE